jgi:hypothetical protein
MRRQLLYDGQFGCRKRWSKIHAIASIIQTTKEVWQKGSIAAALVIHMKQGLPNVPKRNLIR